MFFQWNNAAHGSMIKAMFDQSEQDLIAGFLQSKQKGYSVRSAWEQKFRQTIIDMGEQPFERDTSDGQTVGFKANVAGKFYLFARGYEDIGRHAVAYVMDLRNNELAKFESEGNTPYAPLALAVDWAIEEAKKQAQTHASVTVMGSAS